MTDDPFRLKFVLRVTSPKAPGKVFYYFRSKETGRIRLKGDPGTSAFILAYGEAQALRERFRAGRPEPASDSSFAWLVDRYLQSAEHAALSDATQVDYARTCDLLKTELGDQPYRYITRAMVKTVRDDHAATTRKANKIAATVSLVYGWANQADLVGDGVNPAYGLKKLKRKGGAREYVPWSDMEIAWAREAAKPHELTPLLLFLYTGQRCADVAAMTWLQFQGDLIRVRTSKTQQLIDLPCHPVLKAHLEALRSSSKVVSLAGAICLKDGKPLTTGALGGVIRRLVERVPRIPNNRSPHGLRYAAAARMEEGGATVASIEPVLGHRTFKMALKYASARKRAAEGVAAMPKGVDNG